jgi:WhiB family redox-sensing transcriptional regulator
VSDWWTKAACLALDREMFFPISEPGTPARQIVAGPALKICAGCDVRQDCLDDVLRFPHQHGVAGGLDEDDRRALLRGDTPPRQLPVRHAPGRKPTRRCDRGHPLTDHTVYQRHGVRRCRICRDEAEQVAS